MVFGFLKRMPLVSGEQCQRCNLRWVNPLGTLDLFIGLILEYEEGLHAELQGIQKTSDRIIPKLAQCLSTAVSASSFGIEMKIDVTSKEPIIL